MGCRRRAPVADLIRVVRGPDGELIIGRPGRDGRGAWLCADRGTCLDAAGARGLSRALHLTVRPPEVDALRARLAGRGRIDVRPRRETDEAVTEDAVTDEMTDDTSEERT
ncbi:MAG: YlxR family protein [Acidimicrobiales bacterium]